MPTHSFYAYRYLNCKKTVKSSVEKKVDQLIVLLNFSWFALYAALKFDEIDPRLARMMDNFKRFQTSEIWNKLPIVDLAHDLLLVDAVERELPQITEATLNDKKNEVINLEINKR